MENMNSISLVLFIFLLKIKRNDVFDLKIWDIFDRKEDGGMI